ncbi:MAG: S8 family peptidase, partial [Bryobacteraceae bacterium]
QLQRARDAAGDPDAGRRVRIGILYPGYDPAHRTRPENLRNDLERNFVEGGNSAADPGDSGLLRNPGHGTATLAILAGNRLTDLDPQVPSTGDYFGGAPHAEAVPVRIANSVVLFSNSSFARGLDYVLSSGCHVVSISMGGVASKAWTEVVNRAYDLGVVIAAAAGNNYGGLPTRHIVYPARYRRVIAACGAMANRQPYAGLPISILQGNWGPDSKMETALAAYTPNIPWAQWHCENLLSLDGRGTSAATPQVAAAAALYVQQHWDELGRYTEPWKRVEAVREALFSSASRDGVDRGKLGQGLLRAADALRVAPGVNMTKQPEDDATFAFLRILTGLGVAPPARLEMYGVEAAQMLQGDAGLQAIIPDPDLPAGLIPRTAVRDFM